MHMYHEYLETVQTIYTIRYIDIYIFIYIYTDFTKKMSLFSPFFFPVWKYCCNFAIVKMFNICTVLYCFLIYIIFRPKCMLRKSQVSFTHVYFDLIIKA